MLEASVVICSRNPRPDYLARVLESLSSQTLPREKWELLVVDNASDSPLAQAWPLPSDPRSRHLVESELGISAARRRGIREAVADLIVFVDDDNVLDRTYLSEAVRIKREWPLLGVWGSGSIRGDYETVPPENLEPHLPMLALREATVPCWGNLASMSESVPWGAGLCVRKEVADAYSRLCERSSLPLTGRRGDSLLSGEDKEMAHVCCARGLGIGVFPELQITHLIPKYRVSEEYLTRLAEGTAISDFIVAYKWRAARFPRNMDIFMLMLRSILLCHGLDRRIGMARARGMFKARQMVKTALVANGPEDGAIEPARSS
jgi:glycosyltransferase involved in cell wall biosynthesis